MAIRLTNKRKKILDILQDSKEALSAKEIHTKLPSIDLVTIYRSLELFTKERIITSLHFNSTETKYEFQHTPHHHAVCSDCEKIIHFDAEDAKLKKLLALENFAIDQVEITVRGKCSHVTKSS